MKRKILALTLSLCLCLPLFPLSARGAEDDRLKPGCQRSYYYYLTEEERPLYDFFWESMEDLLAGEACQYTTVGVGKFDRNQWLRAALAFRDDHPAEVAVVVLRGPWGRGWWLDEETDLMQWEWTMELENDDYYYNWMEEYGGRDPAADFLRIKATVKDLAAQCRAAGPSRYDQLLYLHDWLTHNNYYNWTATEEDDYDSNHDDNAPWTAAGALLPEYQPVCEGYSSAFRAVCNELEIPCLMPSSIWTNHAWNLVQMEDGQWYHVDVTSDDPGRSTELVSGRENHTYFLRSDTFFFGDESLGFGENDETGYWPLASKVDYDPSKKPTASTSTPTPTPTPAPTVPTAAPSNQTVTVDGKKVEFAMYSTEGGSVNYIRVRDLAALLNGTAAQFQVGWNGNVALTTKTAYTGPADKAPFNTDMAYTAYTNPTYVDGNAVRLDAIQMEYNGGGYTYYKLRDLGEALGFNVGWAADTGIFVETDKPYNPNN